MRLHAKVWLLIKEPYVGPWEVVPECFNSKHVHIGVRNLSYQVGLHATRKTCEGTLEHMQAHR